MQTIINHLKEKIPQGNWCNNGRKKDWCPFFEVRKPTLSHNGTTQAQFCHLLQEYVTKKMCGINEDMDKITPPFPRYKRQGECLQCGWCCEQEDCGHFQDNKCLIHDDPDRPDRCKLFPEMPPILHEGCGYSFLDLWDDNKVVKRKV